MKQTQHTVSLPNPCHEDWESMPAAGKGRYCAACQQMVIDFTLMTDGQVLDVLKQLKGKPSCGTFLDTQLYRALVDTRYKVSFLNSMAKRITAAVLLLQSVALGAWAQQGKKKAGTTQHSGKQQPSTSTNPTTIRGVVKDHESGLLLANVKVSIQGTDISTVTGKDGAFTLPWPKGKNVDIVLESSRGDSDIECKLPLTTLSVSATAAKNEVLILRGSTAGRKITFRSGGIGLTSSHTDTLLVQPLDEGN